MRVNPTKRGQPFTLLSDLVDENIYQVKAPGFEDWDIVLLKKQRGWRAYNRLTFMSYSHAFGQGGQTIHYRYRAIKDARTGLPLRPETDTEYLREIVERLFLAGEVLPA